MNQDWNWPKQNKYIIKSKVKSTNIRAAKARVELGMEFLQHVSAVGASKIFMGIHKKNTDYRYNAIPWFRSMIHNEILWFSSIVSKISKSLFPF